MIARLQQAHATRQDGGHAGGRRHALLGPFQGGQALLEHGDGGIGEASVDVARLFADEALRRLLRAVEGETGSEEQRLAVLMELALHIARAHRQSFQLVVFF